MSREFEQILRDHVIRMQESGDAEAATAIGEFAGSTPCECPGCVTYRQAVKALGIVPIHPKGTIAHTHTKKP